jgi:hypothetical protein
MASLKGGGAPDKEEGHAGDPAEDREPTTYR